MKLEITRKDFLKSWSLAERFTDINKNILLIADNETLQLKATDLKTSVLCKADGVNVIEDGVAVVPASILGSMIRKSASDDLVLDINSERGFCKAGRSKMRFPVVSANQFPQIADSSSAETICEIDSDTLSTLILEGSSAAGKPADFPKYHGTSLFRTQSGKIKVVSTDGKRLAFSERPCEKISKDTDLLLPAPAFRELAKTLQKDKILTISADAAFVFFVLDGIEFSIRLIDAVFPQYERILNDIVETSLKVRNEDLISALERIDIIASTTPHHGMAMNLNTNGELRIAARSPERGTASESFYADIDGKYLEIGFNVGYFLDGLKILGNGEISIEFSGSESQARMKRAGKDDFLYMLMPARLSEQDRVSDDF